jgi:hypothetical protein
VFLVLVLITIAAFAPPWIVYVDAMGSACQVGPEGISKISPWTKGFFARWDDVESVSYVEWTNSYTVRTRLGIIRIGSAMEGIDFFEKTIARNVPAARRKIQEGFSVLNRGA